MINLTIYDWGFDNWVIVIPIIFTAISGCFALYKWIKRDKNKDTISQSVTLDESNIQNQTIGNNQNIVQNFYNNDSQFEEFSIDSKKTDVKKDVLSLTQDEIRNLTSILFIDDDKQFRDIVQLIKSAGWRNTSFISNADIKDLYLDKIIKAHIIFVDIKGVAKTLFNEEEGLGLADALKDKYPEKKIVLYSAYPEHKLTHPAVRKVDAIIDKNAQPIEFIALIDDLSKQLQWKSE